MGDAGVGCCNGVLELLEGEAMALEESDLGGGTKTFRLNRLEAKFGLGAPVNARFFVPSTGLRTGRFTVYFMNVVKNGYN